MENQLKNILITGTSTGIGEATAKHLSQNGCFVYAGVRTQADFEKWENIENICPVMLDITHKEDIFSVKRQLADQGVTLDALINNAGVTCWGPILELDDDKILEPFRVNLFGTRMMMKYFLPLLSDEHAMIINIGSNSAQVMIPFMGPYPMSKIALRRLTDAVRRELIVTGRQHIKVVLIEPGSIVTPMWEKAKKNIHWPLDSDSNRMAHKLGIYLTDDDMHCSPGPMAVAELIQKILATPKPKTRYYVGRHTYTMMLLGKLPNTLVDRICRPMIKSILKKAG